MFSLTKKTDYALVALGYLAEQPDRVASAREVADAKGLPLPLTMNILKDLHRHGLVRSARGVNGGYQLEPAAGDVTLYDLIRMTEGTVRLIDCVGEDGECDHEAEDCRVSERCSVRAPLQALHHKLVRFLENVRLAEVLRTGPGEPLNSEC